MFYLGALLQLASFVAAIMVIVKLFQTKGAGHGILGIICGIYAFIWGWMNAKTLNLMNLMLIWTLGGAIGYGLMMPTLMKQAAEGMENAKAQMEAAQKAAAQNPAPQ